MTTQSVLTHLHFDRDKYLRMAQSEGFDAALTQLHKDTIVWELDSFEGPQGWNPEQWRILQDDVRSFSRELWEMALRKVPASS